MKAVTLRSFGGPDVLAINDVAQPTPGPDQIRIHVHATALNRADTLQRMGKYPPPPGESDILGLEVAGDVVEMGSNVSGFEMGQPVFALVGSGGYAEYCLVDKDMAMPMPKGWTYEQAAAVPEVFFTANETVFELGELKRGESLLLHAGGSGVGTAAIQMAHHVGATVYFTAGSPEKIERALALGADHGINYKTEDFAEEIKRLTDGKGVDVVEDFLGASYLERNLACLKPGGRLVLVALMGGARCEIDLATVQRKRLQIKGSVMRSRSLEDKRAITRRFVERWLPVLQAGDIQPVIDTVLPLERVREAHERMEANKNFGKIILKIT